jgi:2-polyprenyl-6-methoxyphenol hydroxylase-like FAD-dependent oxidoreductase
MATGLERIAVVGAGLMGTYLALDWARAGHPVTIYDTDHERARTLPERAREIGLQLVHGATFPASPPRAASRPSASRFFTPGTYLHHVDAPCSNHAGPREGVATLTRGGSEP